VYIYFTIYFETSLDALQQIKEIHLMEQIYKNM